MKKHTIITSTAIAALLSLGAATAHAGPGCDKERGTHHMEKMEKRYDRMAEKLGFSEEQKTQLKTLRENTKNELKPLREEKRNIHKEMRELDPSASDYSAKLADLANRKAELERQMIVIKGQQRQRMTQILSPEQLAKMKEMRGKHKKRMRGKDDNE